MHRASDLDACGLRGSADRMELLATIDDPASFTGSSRISGCREDETTPSPLCLSRKTTSPCSPMLTRSDVSGPPARVVVCLDRALRHGVRGPSLTTRFHLITPTDSGRIAARC